ncbi:MAG: CapA family protein [Christensenellales bacterium]
MVRDITQARVDGANIVVVLPHWGTKNRAQTPDTVQTMARKMAQAGADVIFGTHPMWRRGIERLQTVRSDGLDV